MNTYASTNLAHKVFPHRLWGLIALLNALAPIPLIRGWEVNTHVDLGEHSKNQYVKLAQSDVTFLGAEALQAYWNKVSEMLVKEDTENGQINVVFHFWDPVKDIGLVPNIAELNLPIIPSAKIRAQSMWSEAIYSYRQGDYDAAFRSLGRVCHLVQDMAVPAHTLLDPHIPYLRGWRETLIKPLLTLFDENVCASAHVGDGDHLHGYADDADLRKEDRFHWNGSTPMADGDSLEEVMQNLALRSKLYDSDDCAGTEDMGGRPTTAQDGKRRITDEAARELMEILIPAAETAVARVLKLFFDEVCPKIEVRRPQTEKVYSGQAGVITQLGVPFEVSVVDYVEPLVGWTLDKVLVEAAIGTDVNTAVWFTATEISISSGESRAHGGWFNFFNERSVLVRSRVFDKAGCGSKPVIRQISLDSTPPKILNKKP